MILQAKQLRRCFAVMPRLAERVLTLATRDFPPVTPYGPGSAIRLMFDRHGWTLEPDGWFKGPGHSRFNVRWSSPNTISDAIMAAWAEVVQESCWHWNGLAGLAVPSRDGAHHLPAYDRGFHVYGRKGSLVSDCL